MAFGRADLRSATRRRSSTSLTRSTADAGSVASRHGIHRIFRRRIVPVRRVPVAISATTGVGGPSEHRVPAHAHLVSAERAQEDSMGRWRTVVSQGDGAGCTAWWRIAWYSSRLELVVRFRHSP